MSNELPPGLGRSAGIPELRKLTAGQLHDPRYVLGLHDVDGRSRRFRIALPHAVSAEIVGSGIKLQRLPDTFVFEGTAKTAELRHPVRIRWFGEDGAQHSATDPYGFAASLTGEEIREFNSGRHTRAQRLLGSHAASFDGISGIRFSVWAPNAERVSVVGSFNRWDGRCHAMFCHDSSGIWELFIPELKIGEHYKFEIRNRDSGKIYLKSDPFARQYEMRPSTASVTSPNSDYRWRDADWISARRTLHWHREAISIYELHLGSWQRDEHGGFLNYREIAARLAPYLSRLGFTHVELLPITEHPFDDSWGYQTTGFFAPTSRFGNQDDFRAFVDVMHENGIGVILDWVPGHFPKDDHALANFDGTKLFEYEDPRKGEHPDWQTLIFNYSRNEIRSFLISSALYWLEDFHIDALRVDAVASMLYLDYSRVTGQWMPNIHGGNENLEAIEFLKELNEVTHRECPGTITIAEESTAWPKVSRPTYEDGLGFSFKWNMGWMHDTLMYFNRDSIHRRYHHDELTFGPMYAFTENFLLPLSHDEVVHGKGSLLNRMPGDHWQRFANLRLLLTYQWTYPGKKLLFMGSEFGQDTEWNHHEQLPWHLLERHEHSEISKLIADLNALYREHSELQIDCEANGFYWLSWQDDENSVLSFGRTNGSEHLLIILNCTPTPREAYRVGAPLPGIYREIFNSDATVYGGSNYGNGGELVAADQPYMGQPHSMLLHLPPLAGIVLSHRSSRSA